MGTAEDYPADKLIQVQLHGFDLVLLLGLIRNDPLLRNSRVYALWQQRITEIEMVLRNALPDELQSISDLFEDDDSGG